MLVVVEDSASMALEDAAGGAGRWQRGRAVAALVDSLARATGAQVTVTDLAGNGLGPLVPLADVPAPEARGTDLNALAEQVLRRAAGRPVRAAVLVSDGQETRGGVPPRIVATGPHLVVVGVGDREGPADRVIKRSALPRQRAPG